MLTRAESCMTSADLSSLVISQQKTGSGASPSNLLRLIHVVLATAAHEDVCAAVIKDITVTVAHLQPFLKGIVAVAKERHELVNGN